MAIGGLWGGRMSKKQVSSLTYWHGIFHAFWAAFDGRFALRFGRKVDLTFQPPNFPLLPFAVSAIAALVDTSYLDLPYVPAVFESGCRYLPFLRAMDLSPAPGDRCLNQGLPQIGNTKAAEEPT